MARYNYRNGDREPEAHIVEPDVLVYRSECGCEDCIAHPLPRVAEAVQPISRGPRERWVNGIDASVIDAAQRTVNVVPSIKRIG